MRTTEEIKKEIAALTKMKPNVRKYSVFGDNHHDSIDAQIRVLEGKMDEDEVYETNDDEEWKDNVRDAALEAAQWLDGEVDEAPSEDWQSLLVN